jgi:hypothetical protein
MKFLPAATALACTALLVSCGPRQADTSSTQDQARLAEEAQAKQERELHEREAALDERQRVLDEKAQQLAAATNPAPAAQEPQPAAQPQQPEQPPQPVPPEVAAVTPPPSASPSPDASYQAFYDTLSPYGSWLQMPGYGYVWQPLATTQDPRWRPYTMGRWAFTDDGWTWMSDEPFGWITYHYGRWMRTHTLNWVWVPGDQWAPGWVSWRYGNDFVGWAPLPPEARFNGAAGIQQWADQQYNLGPSDYVFVPASEFGDDSMASVEVAPDEIDGIYGDSNNVTNIYYDPGSLAVISYGLSYDFVRSKCRRPLPPPLSLKRAGFLAGGNNRAVIAGRTLTVAAPRIIPTRIPVAPRRIRETVVDARVIAAAAPAPRAVTITQPDANPRQDNAPRTGGGGFATGTQFFPEVNPVNIPQRGPGPAFSRDQAAPDEIRVQPRDRQTPAPDEEAAAQRAREIEAARQAQIEAQGNQQEQAARAAEERQAQIQRAAEAGRAAAEAEAAQVARQERAARAQVSQPEPARQAQGSGVPAGLATPIQGRAPQ